MRKNFKVLEPAKNRTALQHTVWDTFFFASGVGFTFYSELFLQYFTMIMQRIRIIVEDAGFELGTHAPDVWCATNEPPHLNNEPPHLGHYSLFSNIAAVQGSAVHTVFKNNLSETAV